MSTRLVLVTLAAVGAAAWLVAAAPERPQALATAAPSAAASAAPAALPTSAAPAAKAPPVLPPVTGEALAHTCAGCHGTQGRLADEAFVPLAGMPAASFVQTMQDFRSGRRPATLMGHIARGLNDAEFHSMAAYFERQVPAPGSAAALNPLRAGVRP
jgi:sulfide dehydrogenase cytochrome subunit